MGVDGAPAYEKCNSKDADAKRFLVYHAAKRRWKISDAFDDAKVGFAHVRVSDNGRSPPVDIGSHWSVYDGKATGYNEDRDVCCVRLVPPQAGIVGGAASRAVPIVSKPVVRSSSGGGVLQKSVSEVKSDD